MYYAVGGQSPQIFSASSCNFHLCYAGTSIKQSWSPFLSPNGLFLSSPTCRSGTSQTNLRIIPPVKFNPCSSSAIKFPFECRQRIVDYLSSLDYEEKYITHVITRVICRSTCIKCSSHFKQFRQQMSGGQANPMIAVIPVINNDYKVRQFYRKVRNFSNAKCEIFL